MTGSTRALLVGVSQYREIQGLPEAVRNDVADLAALLQRPGAGGLDPSAVTILLDEQATASTLRSALVEAGQHAGEDGTLLFYFSGHGERALIDQRERSWLLPYDAKLAALTATALSSDEIADLLDTLPPRRQVLMIDACHAGGIGTIKGTAAVPKGFGKSGIETLSTGAGRALLTSSRADETSGILFGARNSIFTTALIEAMNGAAIDRGDGQIGVLDVFEYVSRQVPRHADQHPVFHAGSLEGNFSIVQRLPAPKAEILEIDCLLDIFRRLYPTGPTQDEIWSRAGGDVSGLALGGTGTAQWYSALKKAQQGGGGLTIVQLARTALGDYPNNEQLSALIKSA